MTHRYVPVILGTRMLASGYWAVEISVAPGERMSLVIAKMGITQQEAEALAESASPLYPASRKDGLCPMLPACPNAATDVRSHAGILTITSS